MSDKDHRRPGPMAWAVAAMIGAAAGAAWGAMSPSPLILASGEPAITIPIILPFVVLLLCIALGQVVAPRLWHRHYPSVSLFLAGVVAAYVLVAFRMPGSHGGSHGSSYGMEGLRHVLLEYYSFIALVGGLFVVSGGVLVRIQGRPGPLVNTLVLAFGAVLANLIGTTGASMLLIRPFMRLNQGRTRPIHIVFFIFIVSNCGGMLTPIGDPPLYLGFLKGVPFFWTLENLFGSWLFVNVPLLAMFAVIDAKTPRVSAPEGKLPLRVKVGGFISLVALVIMVAAVFIDPLLARAGVSVAFPIGATVQIITAVAAYLMGSREIREANRFNFEPVREVGLLFAGIFTTMAPALALLAQRGSELGLDSPLRFYFSTGVLSAALDNAPTYANMLQVAIAPEVITPLTIAQMISTVGGADILRAISTGAVCFGAMTYIGNGPNFMVRAIADNDGVRMPSFFGYLKLACVILLPLLVLHGLVMAFLR